MQSAQSEEKVAPAPSMDIDAADDDDKQLLQDDGEARYRFDAKVRCVASSREREPQFVAFRRR